MVARRTLRSMGLADGAGAARAYAALGGDMGSDVSSDAVRNDELLHDAGIDTRLPRQAKVVIGLGIAIVLVWLLAAFVLN